MSSFEAREYGRSGDDYGRHTLINPGGDNVQRDVLHIVPVLLRNARRIHPTRFNPGYIGAHRIMQAHDSTDSYTRAYCECSECAS